MCARVCFLPHQCSEERSYNLIILDDDVKDKVTEQGQPLIVRASFEHHVSLWLP